VLQPRQQAKLARGRQSQGAASPGNHGPWNFEAERLGGLEVDHQFVFRRRLHWQVSGLLALEDAIDVAGGATIFVQQMGRVGDQAARAAGAPLRNGRLTWF
jgi:hypothetical protein